MKHRTLWLGAVSAALLAAPLLAQSPDAPVRVPPPSELALRFQRSGVILLLVDLAVAFAVPGLILLTGWSARIGRASARWGRRWYPALAIYLWVFGALTTLITLPLTFYESFVRLHAYGLSTQTVGKWSHDLLIGLAVNAVIGAAVIWFPYLLIRKTPRRWWLWTGLAFVPLTAFMLVISPIWIDPLFNRFEPLPDRPLTRQIHALAARGGIGQARIYRVNKSVDTRALNAYVTGIGGTQRIVLWDTLLDRLDDREVLVVVAHEMGHYVMHHTWVIVLLSGVVGVAGGFAVDRLARWGLRRWGQRIGVERLEDPAALPLLIISMQLVLLVVSPALLALSRHQEHAADRYALELTHDYNAAGRTFVDLQETNLGVPFPPKLLVWLTYSHPPLGERVEFANRMAP
ncbi:MAG TPA: M48 family metallopeptidase [Gemmatimonadales bacterium]|nr:M48 family metallopeptidase [Gemmatimonadales bacterium]